MARFSKADWRLGAIYRVGHRRHLASALIERLLVARCNLKAPQAKQLVAHWQSSEPYRLAA